MPPRIASDSRSQTLKNDALTSDELSLTPPAARPERRLDLPAEVLGPLPDRLLLLLDRFHANR